MACFEPHLRAMWRSHHGCEPPLQRSSGAGTKAAADAADGSSPAGPEALQPAQPPAGCEEPASSGASSSVIYGMLRSGFSWEQLCGNAFQMFFAGEERGVPPVVGQQWGGAPPHGAAWQAASVNGARCWFTVHY
jgi:hypothetical protein